MSHTWYTATNIDSSKRTWTFPSELKVSAICVIVYWLFSLVVFSFDIVRKSDSLNLSDSLIVAATIWMVLLLVQFCLAVYVITISELKRSRKEEFIWWVSGFYSVVMIWGTTGLTYNLSGGT